MGASRLYKVGSPYNASETPEIDVEQTADVMYLAHWDHAPTKLKRLGHTSWQFVTVTFGPLNSPPTGVGVTASTPSTGTGYHPFNSSYVVTSIDATTEQESRASAAVTAYNDLSLTGNANTISWSPVAGASRYIVYKADETNSFGYIGGTESTSYLDDRGGIGADQTDGPPQGKNPLDVAGNWPSTVTFIEQRLGWGRTKNKPNGVWLSQSGNYENMDVSRPTKADDAVSFALVAGRVNAVNQMVSLTDLLALTSDGLFKINGGGQGGYITPSNIVSRRQAGYGSSRLGPLVIGNTVLFKPIIGASVRSIGYTFEIDGYQSNNVTIFSPHLFSGFDIVSWAYAQEPLSCVWAARSDGKLLCFTWEQEQQVWGWTLCETDGFIESVCSITEQGEDRVYLIVQRTVAGTQKRYIERMASARFVDVASSCHLDCATTFAVDTPIRTFGPLNHLEGREVKALADGNVVSGLVVFEGKVTLPFDASVVTIGLPYEATIETLPLAIAVQGTSISKRQMLSQASLKLKSSRGLRAGVKETELYEIKPRVDEPWGVANYELNGDYQVDLPADWSNAATIIVKQTEPLPFQITSILLDPVVTS